MSPVTWGALEDSGVEDAADEDAPEVSSPAEPVAVEALSDDEVTGAGLELVVSFPAGLGGCDAEPCEQAASSRASKPVPAASSRILLRFTWCPLWTGRPAGAGPAGYVRAIT
jgi:hypothetical protein